MPASEDAAGQAARMPSAAGCAGMIQTHVEEPRAPVRAPSRPARASGAESSALPATGETVCREELPPPEAWPPAWRERLRHARPGRALWTYWSLGTDLCGHPDVRRRDFFRRLLMDLGHPAGTHTFWPCALPQPGEPADLPEEFRDPAASVGGMLPAPRIFWAGVRALKCRAVVLMGSAAMKAVALPQPLPPLGQMMYRGCLVWVVRDVDMLLDQPQHYGPTLEFLRRNLQRVIR